MEKTVIIDGKEVKFKATAAVPRLYRIKFRRDILQDMVKLKTAYAKAVTDEERFGVTDLEVFEDCAYIMARHASPDTVTDDVEKWFEEFDTFSIYQVLPEILELWVASEESVVESKKKLSEVVGK